MCSLLGYCNHVLVVYYQVMKWRAEHSTVVSSDKLYCWGGNQKDLPMVHYNDLHKPSMHRLVSLCEWSLL